MPATSTPEALLQQIAQIQHMEKGSLSPLRDRPSANFQRWEAGRNVSEYIPAEQVPLVQQHLAAYTQFTALIDQYVRQVSARSRAERLAGAQKKSPPPTSSSRRKPKFRA